MILAAGKHGLGLRDIAPVIMFFVPDEYRLHRRLSDTDRFKRPVLEADESVRAESALGKLPRHRGDYRRLQGGGR